VIASDDEAFRPPDFERVRPPLYLLLGTDADTLVHLCTGSENLSVGWEAVTDMILHHLRTFKGLDRDQLASRRVVGVRDNTMLLGVLGRSGIGIECFHCFLDICVGLDNMRVETGGRTVSAGRTAKHAIGSHSGRSGDVQRKDQKKVRRSLQVQISAHSRVARTRVFTYAAASGSPRATSSSFFLSVFGNKPNMVNMICC
jgi:hypothetical protein